MDFTDLTVKSAAELLAHKKISAKELFEMSLKRIRQVDDKIHAFLYVAQEQAKQQAVEADQLIADGEGFALTGIPYAVKDNILVKGMQATAGSKILENYKATYDATVIKKLQLENPVIMGKTNLDEFGMGVSTENSAFGPTKNPYDLTRVPGGSSGGSAAAVAAGEVLFALGTDTGGSSRQPASLCGVVGFKPTYGRASRYGLIPLGSSLDQPGVLAKTVEDAAIVFQIMAGSDVHDSTTLPKPVPDYSAFLKPDVKGLRVGVPKEYFIEGIQPEVRQIVEQGIAKFQDLGAIVEEMSLPNAMHALSAYYIILPVEISANLSRYDGIRYGLSVPGKNLEEGYFQTRSQGFGAEVKRRIMIGTYASSAGYYDAYYKKAKQVQVLIKQDFARAFERYDLIVTPTSPSTAFKFGEKTADPIQAYLEDIFTVALNIAGVPGLVVPAGLTSQGLPVGLQIIAPHFAEEKLFWAGHALEQALNLKLKPNL
ncbi:MAG: aspartyl/glutamyl-tRNA amidotransferase subunit A [Candidatus Doudnabacteria bacterium RIFCSPLOWO2_02_FULL_49_13]|uniref:Glutamyl-tRNA(Gln) amidotransferase subunit A n=1 Tax=Candidatus Doudnabacteria bacterium RIFCSPHIGHO2_12_FULL_48_16 TaxID=1817838 RepID=A0A1F5PL66_9BACT|nr:MAG: aspartyl/glutamyl-tRNA amidotransferase subunit A [Candidatus Doudnabacteria bacterium RIFCSPHIGHO2_02_FULL_49_24]OGE88783.1 MAG: aspartyl/glutamyl-tRNA amidotransferase subunit A [Candidatus Doudnabacteria bacterium RIFCSPHIGHO2_01_FULL_50_67]OGE90695.1 MAG: aspartyl/glutamyl-tRNA amidotransferase subunit A [Candidatus Doudnabacteria bacterium RIFCSPHIGHO2_12_FULL_48_16]OGE97762.1 MAG: aspartyl/glutamyl-tRNA amidotransferase subunit A [Candidatus Doudnabacteria bacterium RIFCSPLOWO2_01_